MKASDANPPLRSASLVISSSSTALMPCLQAKQPHKPSIKIFKPACGRWRHHQTKLASEMWSFTLYCFVNLFEIEPLTFYQSSALPFLHETHLSRFQMFQAGSVQLLDFSVTFPSWGFGRLPGSRSRLTWGLQAELKHEHFEE